MIFVIGGEESSFPEYNGKCAVGDVVIIEGETAAAVRLACERVAGDGGLTLVKSPEILSPVLARLCDAIVLSGERLEKITGICPESEVYLCLALKKLYSLGVSRAVVLLDGEVAFADGTTVRYEKNVTEQYAVESAARLLDAGLSPAGGESVIERA